MKQKEARVLQTIVDEVYNEWYSENGRILKWDLPMGVHVSMRKTPCLYCDEKILLGEFRTFNGGHLRCYIQHLQLSERLIETMKNKMQEQGLAPIESTQSDTMVDEHAIQIGTSDTLHDITVDSNRQIEVQ